MHAELGSPSSDQIERFAVQMQHLADQKGTEFVLTIASPTESLGLGGLPPILAAFPVDGYVFHVHPSGDLFHLHSYLQLLLSRGAP